MAAVSVVARWLTPLALHHPHRLQPLRRAETSVGMAGSDQLLGIFKIDGAPLCLVIGAIRAAHVRAFVPIQPKPAEPFEDGVNGALHCTRGIGVFDADNELAPIVAREQPAKERRAEAPDVLDASWARRETSARLHV